MKNFYKQIITLILILSIIFFALLFIKLPLSENLFIHHGSKVYPLWRGENITQGFIPRREFLVGFNFKFKKINDTEHPVKIELTKKISEKETKTLYESKFSSREIEGNKFYSFIFSEPLKGQGEEYWLIFSADVASESASISPVVSQVNNYLEGKSFGPKGQIEGDILFKPIYQVDTLHFISYYLNKIVFGKPKLFNKFIVGGLLGFWVLTVVILQLFLFALASNKVTAKKALLTIFLIILIGLTLFSKPTSQFVFKKIL